MSRIRTATLARGGALLHMIGHDDPTLDTQAMVDLCVGRLEQEGHDVLDHHVTGGMDGRPFVGWILYRPNTETTPCPTRNTETSGTRSKRGSRTI